MRAKVAFLIIIISNIAVMLYADQEFKIMSWNIRFETSHDEENTWVFRKNIFMNAIKSRNPDIICLQEVLPKQLADILSAFPEYTWFGRASEWEEIGLKEVYTPILIRKSKFKILEKGQFWLSQDPEIPSSQSWNARFSRHVTWVRLKGQDDTFFVFNTHFDHYSQKARLESSILLTKRIHQLSGFKKVILAGDFNTNPYRRAWKVLTGRKEIGGIKSLLKDAYDRVHHTLSRRGTLHLFKGKPVGPIGQIDWILMTDDIRVHDFDIIRYNEKGRYPSDHFGIMAYCII